MDFDKLGGKSNNFIIWLLLLVIAFGFGKCGESLGFNFFKVDNNSCDDKQRGGKHGKNDNFYVSGPRIGNYGLGGLGSLGGLFGGNLLFIIVIVALLFLCKDKEDTPLKDSDIDYENVNEV